MKIYLAAFALWMISGGLLYAQKATYLKAELGFGRGTVRGNNSYRSLNTGLSVSAGRVAVVGGVQVKKLSVEIGFGYARTGGRYADAMLGTSFTHPEGQFVATRATHRISHLTMPLTVGYDLRAGKRWGLQPRLGLEGAYTAGAKLTDVSVSNTGEGFMVSKEPRPLKDFSLHGSAALHLHYRVTPGIEIFGGPSYRHMLTNGAAETLYTRPPYYQVRTTSATFDAGLKLQLNRTSAAPKAPQE